MRGRSDRQLLAAFEADGYVVARTERYGGHRGILARSREDPDRTVIYVEGPPFARGYLVGLLAGDKVERMAGQFVDNVVPAFVAPSLFHPLRFRRLKRRLVNILRDRCLDVYDQNPRDIPDSLKEEIKGIAAGCKARNPQADVDYGELFLLNAGVDFLLSYVYTGAHIFDWITRLEAFLEAQRTRSPMMRRLAALVRAPRIRPWYFRVPYGCNAFALGRRLTRGHRQLFGRDFMFPTASVFHETCCLIVYGPEDRPGGARADRGRPLPVVSLTAPGLVGSVTAMNSRGVALGVDMLPGQNCNIRRPGLNSLLLVRWCADHARSFEEAVDLVVDAQRGVSWLYLVAGGDRAAAIEAGARVSALNGLAYVPARYLRLLSAHPYQRPREGAMVRDSGWVCPQGFAELNGRLFALRRKSHSPEQELPDGRYHTRASRPWKQKAVPRSFYFPPQRESLRDLLIAANQALTPEMRLCAMGSWVSLVSAGTEDDLQWRYDELASQIREALGPDPRRPRRVSLEQAKALIDFLSPLRKFPAYYAHNASSPKGRRIEGAITLCDLTTRVMHAYYGHYDDRWVRLTLPAYCG